MYYDRMNRYGFQIYEESGKYYYKYNTGDHLGSTDTFEITKEAADQIIDIYAPIEGKNIFGSEEGRNAIKEAVKKSNPIFFHFKNKRDGFI